jgi:hypothetical protein
MSVAKRRKKNVNNNNPDNIQLFFTSNVIMSRFIKFLSPMSFMRLLCSVPWFLRCRNKYMKDLKSKDVFDACLRQTMSEYLCDAVAADIIIKCVSVNYAFFMGDIVSSTLDGYKPTNVDIMYPWDECMAVIPHQCVSKVVTQKPQRLHDRLLLELNGRFGGNSGIHGAGGSDYTFGPRSVVCRAWSQIYINPSKNKNAVDLYETHVSHSVQDFMNQHPSLVLYGGRYLRASVNKKTKT